MSNKSSSSSSGMGCGGVIQVVFIILKLLNLIDWSWWWVMSPTLITAGIILFFVFRLSRNDIIIHRRLNKHD